MKIIKHKCDICNEMFKKEPAKVLFKNSGLEMDITSRSSLPQEGNIFIDLCSKCERSIQALLLLLSSNKE